MDKSEYALISDPDEPRQMMALYSLKKNMDITFTDIPLPPSSNNMYENSQRGGRTKSREMRDWERDFAVWALANGQAFARGRQLLKSRLKPGTVLAMHCTFFFARSKIFCKDGSPKRRDTSNYLKALHDAMAECLSVDDAWFFDGMMRKRPVDIGDGEGATVELEFIPVD